MHLSTDDEAVQLAGEEEEERVGEAEQWHGHVAGLASGSSTMASCTAGVSHAELEKWSAHADLDMRWVPHRTDSLT